MSRVADGSRPIALRTELAGGLALVGVMLGMAGLGGGWLSVGVFGLVVVGIAAGFAGSLRSRIVVAVSIWVVATLLGVVSAASGSRGFAIAGSMVFALLAVALGQLAGLVAGIACRDVGQSVREVSR